MRGCGAAGEAVRVRACEEHVRDDLSVAAQPLLEAPRRLVPREEGEGLLVRRRRCANAAGITRTAVHLEKRLAKRLAERLDKQLAGSSQPAQSVKGEDLENRWPSVSRTVPESVEGNQLVVVEPLERPPNDGDSKLVWVHERPVLGEGVQIATICESYINRVRRALTEQSSSGWGLFQRSLVHTKRALPRPPGREQWQHEI